MPVPPRPSAMIASPKSTVRGVEMKKTWNCGMARAMKPSDIWYTNEKTMTGAESCKPSAKVSLKVFNTAALMSAKGAPRPAGNR